jgi:hypothetical protein
MGGITHAIKGIRTSPVIFAYREIKSGLRANVLHRLVERFNDWQTEIAPECAIPGVTADDGGYQLARLRCVHACPRHRLCPRA